MQLLNYSIKHPQKKLILIDNSSKKEFYYLYSRSYFPSKTTQ